MIGRESRCSKSDTTRPIDTRYFIVARLPEDFVDEE